MSLLTRNEPSQGSFVRVFLLCCSFSHKNSQMCLLTRNEPSQGSFRFPPPAGCFFCGRPARPAMLPVEAKQPIPWYQPHTGTSEIPKSLSISLVVTPPHRGGEVGGWGQDPKKFTGRDWVMGSSTIFKKFNEPYASS